MERAIWQGCRWPLGTKSSPPPHLLLSTSSKKASIQSYNCKELNSASKLNALRSEFFRRGAWPATWFWPCETLSRGYSAACLETDLQNYEQISRCHNLLCSNRKKYTMAFIYVSTFQFFLFWYLWLCHWKLSSVFLTAVVRISFFIDLICPEHIWLEYG